jgi:hypothetical protein
MKGRTARKRESLRIGWACPLRQAQRNACGELWVSGACLCAVNARILSFPIFLRRTRAANRAERHTPEHNQSAKQGIGPHPFAEEQEHPDRVQDRFQGPDQVGLQRGDVFDAFGEEHEGKSDLEQAEIGNDQPIGGSPGFLENGRKTEYGHGKAGNESAFRGRSVFLGAEGNHHHGGGHAAQNGQNIPIETIGAQFIPEEQHQSRKNDEHRNPVRSGGLFAQEPERQQDNVNGRGVLQEDGVGGSGQFGGRDEQELGQDGSDRRQDLPAGPLGGNAAQINEKYQAGKQAAPGEDRHRLPVDDLDQNPAGAPQDGSQPEKNQRFAAF